MNVFYSKIIKPDYVLRHINLTIRRKAYSIGYGWAYNKGDWWHESGLPKKFLSAGKVVGADKVIRYGVYIGRLGLVYMKRSD